MADNKLLIVFVYLDVSVRWRRRRHPETQEICKFSITVVGRPEARDLNLGLAKRKCNYKTAGLCLKVTTVVLYLPNYKGTKLNGRRRGKTHGDDRLGVGSALPSDEERDII